MISDVSFFTFQNDFRRFSLYNNHYSLSDLNKAGSLFSVAEVNSQSNTPQIRRSATNPTNLRNSFSLESLRDFSEKSTLKDISKNDKQYTSNPLFDQNVITEGNETYSGRRMGSIPGRIQSAMSLESLHSTPDSKAPSSDSGLDDSQHMNEGHGLETIPSGSDSNDDNSEKIDVSMFEMRAPVGTKRVNNAQKLNNRENEKNNKVFTINVDNTDNEEERLNEIYIDISSAYP